MDFSKIKTGLEVWVLDHQRVRRGTGPTKHTVADVMMGSGAARFRAAGTRGMFTNYEAYETEAEARLAWSELAEAELRKEAARFNKIATRLSAWQKPVGAA